MLHIQRKQIAERDHRENIEGVFWTQKFSPEVRTKINLAISDCARGEYVALEIGGYAAGLFYRATGLQPMTTVAHSQGGDFFAALALLDDEKIPSLIEGAYSGFCRFQSQYPEMFGSYAFAKLINEILVQHRIGFELIEGSMIERELMELHAEVVAPALQLLSSRKGWEPIEQAYRKALEEIATGDPADAITDAGTALQETLEILGCNGNSLGTLIGDGRKRGFFAPHDSVIGDAICKTMNWVAADRSAKGDGHHTSSASREDAWLTVHIVGALILRLVSDRSRGDS